VRRSRGTLFLVLAYLTALVAPLRSGWTCPDGTPCEAMRQPVCTAHPAEKSCCEKPKVLTCKHSGGALTPSAEPQGPQVETPDHCRFHVSVPPQLIAMTADGTGVVDHGTALPVSLYVADDRASTGAGRLPALALGYRPPPLLESGPSRAPPAG
jgi:hypothetical protein